MLMADDDDLGPGSLSPKTYSISEYRHLLAKLKAAHQVVPSPITVTAVNATTVIPALNHNMSVTETYRRDRLTDKSDVLRRAMERINRQRSILPANIIEP